MKKIKYIILLTIVAVSCNFKITLESEKTNDLLNNKYFISEVLKNGNNEFDPWNKKRWADWYNKEGELIRQFDIDVSVRFKPRIENWTPKFCTNYNSKALFITATQVINIDIVVVGFN